MKRLTKIVSLVLAVLMLFAVCGCDRSAKTAEKMLALNDDGQTVKDLVGYWSSYGTVQLQVNEDGTGRFYGTDCSTIDFNGEYLYIEAANGMSFSIQARLFGDDLVLFDTPYTYNHFSGIARRFDSGKWSSKGDDYEYSFEFSEGKFVEDGVYTGSYAVDGDEIVLIYDECDDYAEGDYSYGLYHIDEDVLSFYYGLPLMRTTDAPAEQTVSAADAA